MTNEAPERIAERLLQRAAAPGVGVKQSRDMQAAASALTTAQARIAELEAALRRSVAASHEMLFGAAAAKELQNMEIHGPVAHELAVATQKARETLEAKP
jgi:hypothetical protein